MPLEKYDSPVETDVEVDVTQGSLSDNNLTLENVLKHDEEGQAYSEIACASGSDSGSDKHKTMQLATSAFLRQERLDKWQEDEEELPELEEFDQNENHSGEENNVDVETIEVNNRNSFSPCNDDDEIHVTHLRNRIARYSYYNKKKEKENEEKMNNSKRNQQKSPVVEIFDAPDNNKIEVKIRGNSFSSSDDEELQVALSERNQQQAPKVEVFNRTDNNNKETKEIEVKILPNSSSSTDNEDLQVVHVSGQVARYNYYEKKDKESEEKMKDSEKNQSQSEANYNKMETEKEEVKIHRNSLSSSTDVEKMQIAFSSGPVSLYNYYNKIMKGKENGETKYSAINQQESQDELNKNDNKLKNKRKKKRRNSFSSSTDDEEIQHSLLRSRIARYNNYYNKKKENEEKMKNYNRNQQEPQPESSINYNKNKETKKKLPKSSSSPLTLSSEDEKPSLFSNRIARYRNYNKKKENEEKIKNFEINQREPESNKNDNRSKNKDRKKKRPNLSSSSDDDIPLGLLSSRVSRQNKNLPEISDKNYNKIKSKRNIKKRPNSSSSPLTLSTDEELIQVTPLSSRIPRHRHCKWRKQDKDHPEINNFDKNNGSNKSDNKTKSEKGRKKRRKSSSSSEDERVQLSLLNSRVARYRQPNSECSTSYYLYKHCSITEMNARKHFQDDGFFRYKPPFPMIEDPRQTKRKSVKFSPKISVLEDNVDRTPTLANGVRGRRKVGGRKWVRGFGRVRGTYTVKIKLVLKDDRIEVEEEIEEIEDEE